MLVLYDMIIENALLVMILAKKDLVVSLHFTDEERERVCNSYETKNHSDNEEHP